LTQVKDFGTTFRFNDDIIRSEPMAQAPLAIGRRPFNKGGLMQSDPIRKAQELPALKTHPSKLFVETTSRCNLNCFMCVKQSADGGIVDGDLATTTFARLGEAMPYLDALVLNGIGEALLHPRLEDFIRLAKARMPTQSWVGFQSNGVLLNERRALSLVEAGLDRIGLSLDGVTPETFRRVREGGELAGVERALSVLSGAGKSCGRADLEIGVEFVLMRENLRELPAALRWSAQRGATFAIVSHLLPYDASHASQALYPASSDAALELFSRWQGRAEREGIDLERYFKLLWRFSRSPEEKRIIAFVEELKAEAEGRGIAFDLKKLLAEDPARQAGVAQILEEARQVAIETGLDLRLPAEVPRQHRRCDFIEDGGAFVSWAGDVHPCYFLWHRYSCFTAGWQQQVTAKTFGNLNQKGLLEIWNAPSFRTFREGALGYDHAPCSSCAVVPCDLVDTQNFEHDCHIKEEPCGACLWATGLFQCLR
jgi:putative metalloenzyme radical SAM/SPASM domain maturase